MSGDLQVEDLILAVINNHCEAAMEAVQILKGDGNLFHPANRPSLHGLSALMTAVLFGRKQLAQNFVDDGARLFDEDAYGKDARDYQFLRFQVFSDAIEEHQPVAWSPLDRAIFHAVLRDDIQGIHETVLSCQESLEAKMACGITPLMLASLLGAENAVNELVRLGANEFEIDSRGMNYSDYARAAHYLLYPTEDLLAWRAQCEVTDTQISYIKLDQSSRKNAP